MIGRWWLGRDRGSFTAEMAAGLPALMLLLFVGMTAVAAVGAKGECEDDARAAALAVARGERARAPAGESVVSVVIEGDQVRAEVVRSVRIFGKLPAFTVTASAVAAREPSAVP